MEVDGTDVSAVLKILREVYLPVRPSMAYLEMHPLPDLALTLSVVVDETGVLQMSVRPHIAEALGGNMRFS